MKIQFKYRNDCRPVDPKWPNGWRGAATLAARVGETAWRVRWMARMTENDWRRLDSATFINLSPIWAKWFHFSAYHSAGRRHIWHLTIGHFNISILPLVSSYPTLDWIF